MSFVVDWPGLQALWRSSLGVYAQHFLYSKESWIFGLIPLYILTQPLLALLVSRWDVYNENKPRWKVLMVTYNLGLSVFSLASAVLMTRIVLLELPQRGFHESNFSHPTYAALVYYFYISKYVEFFDTYFLLLQKKEVSLLQWLHHVGAPLNVGLLYYTQDPGAHLFIILNGFIHTLLYLYYAATISGFKVRGKWVLTALQIAQFNVGFYIYTFFLQIPAYRSSAQSMASHLFTWAYVGVIELLFLHFFVSEYLLSGSKKPRSALLSSHSSHALLDPDAKTK